MDPVRTETVPRGLPDAVSEWKTLLGAEWVDTSSDRIARLERATFHTTGRVLAQLRPGDVGEVAACLRIAVRHKVPVNIVSGAKAHGYHSSGPAEGATAAIELSRLNAITEFDDELGYVRVQAGVTFAQLHRFLDSHASRHYLPTSTGTAEASVLACVVERGYGLGDGGDFHAQSCRYEVVTARGETFETGFGRFEESRVANLLRTGVGPALDGLFTQSSLGVVTAATLLLPRRFRYHYSFVITTPTRARIGSVVDCLGEAMRQGVLRNGSAVALAAYRLASLQLRREDLAAPEVTLSWDALGQSNRPFANSAWLTAGSIQADTRGMLRAKERALGDLVRARLEPDERLIRLTAFRARLARVLSYLMPKSKADAVRQFVSVFYERTPLLGHHQSQLSQSIYWAIPRSQHADETDPDAAGVGLLWVSVLVPLRGSEITEVCNRIDEGLLAFGFEPSTQVELISERLALVETALMYNRTESGNDARAILCQSALYADLRRGGYYAYRLQPHLMQEYSAYGTDHQTVAARIKLALDPEGVLDPSRYPALNLVAGEHAARGA